MSDEEDNQDFEHMEVPVQVPQPRGIWWPEDFEKEMVLVSSWIKHADETDADFSIEENATTESLKAIWHDAIDSDILEGVSEENALILLVWWSAWNSSENFQKFKQNMVSAQAMMGVAANLMGIQGSDIIEAFGKAMGVEPSNEEDEDEDSPGENS